MGFPHCGIDVTKFDLSLNDAALRDLLIENLEKILQMDCEMLAQTLSVSAIYVDYVFRCASGIVGIRISRTIDPDEIRKIRSLLKGHFQDEKVSLVIFLTGTPPSSIEPESIPGTTILAASANCILDIKNLTGGV